MTTYRERREARAERLREWAEKREAQADSAYNEAHRIGDQIPFGQPILVGHHSERGHRRDISRIDAAMSESVKSSRMATSMESRADTIDAQLRESIYDDDPDAVEQLHFKLARLEAERDRIKAFNASCRKGVPNDALLDAKQLANLESIRKVCAYQLGKNGSYPAYALQNLGGNITRVRKRIEYLGRVATIVEAGGRGRGRAMEARYGGECADCGGKIERGDAINYYRVTKEATHASCPASEEVTV